MPKFKRTAFKPWESKKDDGFEKRYTRIASTQLASEPMRTLSASAFKILIYMKIEAGGRKEFTFSNVKYRAFMSKPTFFKVLNELVEKGFIDIKERNKNQRISNVYLFSERWKDL